MQQLQKVMIWVLVLLQLVSVSGCTSTHTMVGPSSRVTAASIRESVKVGDSLELFLQDGAALKMKLKSMDETALTGVDSAGEVHEVPISSIEGLMVKRMSVGKTLMLVGVIGILTWGTLELLFSGPMWVAG